MIEETELTAERVARKVAEYLRDCHPDGVTLEVVEPSIRKEEYSWRVPVRPNREPSKPLAYYEALTDVEMALEDNEHLNVFLVPWDPVEAQAI